MCKLFVRKISLGNLLKVKHITVIFCQLNFYYFTLNLSSLLFVALLSTYLKLFFNADNLKLAEVEVLLS